MWRIEIVRRAGERGGPGGGSDEGSEAVVGKVLVVVWMIGCFEVVGELMELVVVFEVIEILDLVSVGEEADGPMARSLRSKPSEPVVGEVIVLTLS